LPFSVHGQVHCEREVLGRVSLDCRCTGDQGRVKKRRGLREIRMHDNKETKTKEKLTKNKFDRTEG
jgi:hypothetical protein